MKKNIFIGVLALLVTVSCGKKDGSKSGAKDKAQITYVKDDLSSDRLSKYTEYVRISEVPNSDEWIMLFDGIDEGKFKNANGEVLTNLKGNDAIENIKSSVKLLGNQIRDLEDVMQRNPKFETIDKNAENLLKSLVEEQKVLNEIDDYFEKGEYKADNLGKVKELNDKYKLVSQTRKENDKILTTSLQEMSILLNKKLAEKFGVVLEYDNYFNANNKKSFDKYYEMNEFVAKFYYKKMMENLVPKQYLSKRGINQKSINLFFIGYADENWKSLYNELKSKNMDIKIAEELGLIIKTKTGDYIDRFRNRIMFPILNINKQIIKPSRKE
mgnify:CR=1 FL=1